MSDALMSRRAYFMFRCLLAGVFLYAGVGKLMDVNGFATVISGYGLLPGKLNFSAAIFLPVAEILVAAGLIWDFRGALFSYTALLLGFMAVLAYGINMGLDVDCGCFAQSDPEREAYHSLREALLRDAGLVLICGYLYWLRKVKGYRPRSLPFFTAG